MQSTLDLNLIAGNRRMHTSRGAGRRCLHSLQVAANHLSQQLKQVQPLANTSASRRPSHSLPAIASDSSDQQQPHLPSNEAAGSALEHQQTSKHAGHAEQQQRALPGQLESRLFQAAAAGALSQAQPMQALRPRPRPRPPVPAAVRTPYGPLAGTPAAQQVSGHGAGRPSPHQPTAGTAVQQVSGLTPGQARQVVAAAAASQEPLQQTSSTDFAADNGTAGAHDNSNGSSNNSSNSSDLGRLPVANGNSRPRPRPRRPVDTSVTSTAYTASAVSQSSLSAPSQFAPISMQQPNLSSNGRYRGSYMQQVMSPEHHEKLLKEGLTALPDWHVWGDQQLLQDWNAAVQQLPAAVERLEAVSTSGPLKLVCFDLETCGPNRKAADITEIGAIASNLNGSSFQQLVRPISCITPGAQQTTGITWNTVKDQPLLPQVLLQWLDWLTEQCSSSPGGNSTLVLMGHNITQFDLDILQAWAKTFRLRDLLYLLGNGNGSSSSNNEGTQFAIIDTHKLAREQLSSNSEFKQLMEAKGSAKQDGSPSIALQSLRQAFEVPQNQAHRALEDVTTNFPVFVKVAQFATSSSSNDPEQLAELVLQQTQQSEAAAAEQKQQQKQQRQAFKEREQQQQRRREEQQQEQEFDLDSILSQASTGSSSSSTRLMYQPGLAAEGLPPPPDPDLIESRVSSALETLTDLDLRFDQAGLRSGWEPLTQPVGLKMKGFTEKQAEKLVAAGFENLFKVLMYVPKVTIYAPAIRISGSSSSSSTLQQGIGADESSSSSNVAASSSIDDADEDDPTQQMVELKGRVLAAFPPKMWGKGTGATWQMLIEAPTDPPEAGPVVLAARFNEYAYTSFMALAACKQAHAAATAAKQQDKMVVIRSKVKQIFPWQSNVIRAVVEWETDGKIVVSYEGAADADSSGSSSPSLVPVYKTIRELKADDWLSKGRNKGVAEKALDVLRGAKTNFDLLPTGCLQQYGLPNMTEALQLIHQPTDLHSLGLARTTLALQEITLVQIAQLLERYWLQRGMQMQQSSATAAAAALPQAGSASSTLADSESDSTEPTPKRGRSRKAAAAKRSSSSGSSSAGSLSSGDDLQQQFVQGFATPQAPTAAAYQISQDDLVAEAKEVLPYELTDDQEMVLSEVLADMSGSQAMLRLLQGDVGCGKTVVAALACLAAAGAGYQALMLAPTELLATQHMATLQTIAEQLPLAKRPRVQLLSRIVTSKPKEKAAVYEAIANGRVDILVSTQAALFVQNWGKLALVVVDEQHKFGVKQREKLLQNLAAPPHMLLMTATPIPRSLALVTYGGLVLSKITQMPPGRRKVDTKVIVDSDETREQVYTAIHDELVSGGRVYIVCPLVHENGDLEDVRAATDEYERLQKSGHFGDFKCGLLHGKMKGEEKTAVLRAFSAGETPVLIASTVVEVGIDEPEASIMLVENADRFGLAQLHQLRGRVGRGSRASRCFLMAPPADWDNADRAAARLRVLEKSHNGLKIAEADLKIRGPGDVWGTKQSGKASAFSTMTWQELEAAPQLLDHARAAAAELLPQLGSKPEIKAALLAYGLLQFKEGQSLPVLRDGVSGV